MSQPAVIADPRARSTFTAALDLVGRLGVVTALGAIGTLAITRLLGPTGYGSYASAIATFALLGAAADFGFSFMLSREAPGHPERHRPLLRATYEVAGAWSLLLAVVMLALAFSAGVSSDRGMALLVLVPSMAVNGLNPARTVMIVIQRTRQLLVIDVLVLVAQLAASVGVAAAGLGPVAVAVAVSAGSIVNNLVVSAVVARTLAPAGSQRYPRAQLVRRCAPLGLAAIMTRVYLTIDLVLLGWLVTGPRLGQYAAAAKVVAVLGGVAGAVMSAALPALAAHRGHRCDLENLTARIWHWLVVVALPIFVALAVFAGPLVRLAFGAPYARAAPLLQVLAAAGAIGVLSNLTGNLLVVLSKHRAMVTQNGLAIVVNVAGNLILVPRLGVVAAAWMTVATEALVCLGSIISLRREIALARVLRVGGRPAIAVVIAGAVALALAASAPLLAAGAGAVTFLGLLSALSGWPAEFALWRPSTG